jgi:hypothetical protein
MIEFVPAATFIVALMAATFAVLGFIFIRRIPAPIARTDVSELLRFEGDAIRAAAEGNTRTLRLEIGQTLSQNQSAALSDSIRRECNVTLAGPTTFAATLHAFQANYRSMAVAQRSGDVWNILRAVRTEFKRYGDTVGKVARQLNTAAGSVVELGKRTDMMDRALRNVETMPDDGGAAKLLGLEEKIPDGESEADMLISAFVPESPAPIIVSSAILDEENGARD